jgi:anti-sigma factor RsiW
MRCAECRETLNALVDGEIAGDEAVEIRDHLAGCAECQREHHMLIETSSLLKEGLVRHPAPDVLKARLRSALAQSQPFDAPRPIRGPSWMALAAAGLVIAVASSATTLAVARREAQTAPGAEVLASHLRSLMPGHLTDVASTNQHNVKPWFNGRVDFAPAVPDLDSAGFPLLGGRLDYVGDRPVAAMVYGRREHKISVYAWPAESSAGDHAPVERDVRGYHLMTWRSGGLVYWAVSDLNPRELAEFVRAFTATR